MLFYGYFYYVTEEMQHEEAKRNAILGPIAFLLIAAGAAYSVIYGLGNERVGLAKDIPLGLDLQGGVSVT